MPLTDGRAFRALYLIWNESEQLFTPWNSGSLDLDSDDWEILED
jgi:hypothetical protein